MSWQLRYAQGTIETGSLRMRGEIKPRVFVVDDEQVIAFTLAAILNQSGFTATAFTDPRQALVSAETDTPDFLISDVMMPQLNGIDLGVQFKAIYPNCRILLFSGQAATSDLLDTARAQGHDFEVMSKPVHPNELLAALGALATSSPSK